MFTRSPKEEWPMKVKNVVLTGRPFLGMPFMKDDVRKRSEGKHPFSQLRGVPRRGNDEVHTGAVRQVTTDVTTSVPTRDLVSREDCKMK